MKLLGFYLKGHRKGIAVFFLFSLIFFVIFALYQLPLESVCYAILLCIFLGSCILLSDFLVFCRRHRRIQLLMEEITVTTEHLPQAVNLIEMDYQKLVRALFEHKVELADEKNRRYSELVEYYTVWVHQIKTPIAALRLMLQEKDLPEYRQMQEELQRIEQYVDMVLTYLRLDSDSTDYVIANCDLDEIIRQAVRKFAPQFIRRRLRLEYEPFSCRVLTDEKWLLFVVEQVLSNALKYTKKGSISIKLEEGKILCIQDTGIGIEPEDLPRIFEKGYTGYNGRSDKKASGIGLYLCRRICRNLGHEIWVESDGVSGTSVRLCLDRKKLEVE
ncbi:MAG: sensor histidine kinase [Lachnospiraceae bacterium]|nr:sensor histidine kinase [Lachnospiraceae bacterium]